MVATAGWLALHLSESNNTMTGPRVAHTAGEKKGSGPLNRQVGERLLMKLALVCGQAVARKAVL